MCSSSAQVKVSVLSGKWQAIHCPIALQLDAADAAMLQKLMMMTATTADANVYVVKPPSCCGLSSAAAANVVLSESSQ